jgi:S-(hydroxymethyl)glutathione dehydrogenase / alcohol dehydrogenase
MRRTIDHPPGTPDPASAERPVDAPDTGMTRRTMLKSGAAGALAAAGLAGDALAQAPAAPAVLTGAVAGMRYRAFMRRQGQPVVAEVRLRELDPRHVLVRTEASSGCYTSAGQVLGGGGGAQARASIPNHSGAGSVIAVGAQVRRVRVGDRVIVSGTSQCGACYQCLHGAPEACNYLAVPLRVIGDLEDGTEVVQAGNIGGFAELMVALEEYCVPCFTDLPSDQLAMLGDTFGAGFASTQTYAPIEVGSDVVIFGAGPVGLAAVQGARANSAAQIIVVEPIAYRRERALALGATTVLDPNVETDTLVNRIRAMCSGPTDRLDAGGRIAAGFFSPTGADFVIEASGGDFRPPEVEAGPDPTGILALEQAWAVTRGGGHLTTLAIGQRGTISFNPTFFCVSTRHLHGGQMGGQWVLRDNARYIRAAEAGRIDIGALVTARYPLTAEAVVEGFERIVGRTELGVIFDPRT